MSRAPPRHARLDVTAALRHAPHVASSDARIFCASLSIELLARAGHTGPHGPPSAQTGSHSPAPAAYISQRGGPRFLLPHIASPSSRHDPALAIAAALLELSRALASCSARTKLALGAHSPAPPPP